MLGVCGTDREIVSGAYGEAPPGSDRLVLGHESYGEVIAAPPGGRFAAGDHIVVLDRLDEGRTLFKRLVVLCNDVGLLSEEYDPASKQLLGNFPQAFSHVALINSAFNLTRASKPAEQRADHSAAAR